MFINKKKIILIILVILLLSTNAFSAIISDNDGSAFVTKAEFDALKHSFNKQINDYNTSIDSKIDGAIASYLAGISISHAYILDSLVNKCNSASGYGRDVKFIKSLTDKTVSYPTGSWHATGFMSWYGNYDRGRLFLYGGNAASQYNGGVTYEPRVSKGTTDWNAYKHFIGTELKSYVKNGNTYWCVDERNNLFDVVYKITIQSYKYSWQFAFGDGVSTTALPSLGTTWYLPSVDDTKFTLDSNGYIDWEAISKNLSFSVVANNMYAYKSGWGAKSNCNFSCLYNQNYEIRSRSDWKDLGYLSDTFDKGIYFIDKTKWEKAVYMNSKTETDTCTAAYFGLKDNGSDYDASGADACGTFEVKTAVYWHDIKTINVDHLINEAATSVVTSETNPVLLYEGLPIFTSDSDGTVKFILRGTASTYDGSTKPSTWTGKLYISNSRFGKGTTKSNCTKKGESSVYTGYWTISNATPTAIIELQVKKGETYWLKYNVDTATTGLCVGFETDGDVVLTVDD